MRLIGAELLKMRRRQMTYVLPITLVAVMAAVLLLIGSMVAPVLSSLAGDVGGVTGQLPFDSVYVIAGNFVFGLGSLLVIIYTGGIVGGDYSWGVLRNVYSRGESRINYALAKAVALAVVVAIAATVCLLIGAGIVLLLAADARIDLGSPFSADALVSLARALGLGLLVLFERGLIGFAVTVLLRSQLAGIVVGVILYIAEPFVAGIAVAFSQVGNITGLGTATPQVHWSQYLPFTIGSSVLAEAHASLDTLTAANPFTAVVPLAQSVPVLLLYGVVALTIALVVMRRQEIVG